MLSFVAIASPGLATTTVFGAPNGLSAGACEAAAPCSLAAAQARVRTLRAAGTLDIDVSIANGDYRLAAPLQFGAPDSGAPDHPVRWAAAPGAHPRFLGSRRAIGQHHGKDLIVPLQSGDLVDSVVVDGAWRQPERSAACPRCRVDAYGLWQIPDATMDRLRVGSIAVLHARWRDFHCAVTELGHGRVTLAQPCWHNATLDSRNDWRVASPVGKYYGGVDWFEGLRGDPSPGHFTIDTAAHALVYRPAQSDAAAAPAIDVPVTEHLLQLDGTPDAPVHDLVFSGITFSGTGWRQPARGDGYVSLQAGYLVRGQRRALPDNGEGMARIDAAVSVIGGRRIAFDHDRFERLGAAGIALAGGTRGAVVTRSHFSELGGGAIFVGDTTAHPTRASDKSADIVLDGNTIDHVAQLYRDNVAIMAGFLDGIAIAHNTISDLPYSGISVGWGWNYEGDAPVQSSIEILANRIERVMLQLADGGAIYTQGTSAPGTSCIAGNAIDMRRSGEGNGIYLDEHSVNFDVTRNVVLGAWVSAWADWSGHLRIVGNWTDTAGTPHNPGPTKIWSPNATSLKQLPADAATVWHQAGAQGWLAGSRTIGCAGTQSPEHRGTAP